MREQKRESPEPVFHELETPELEYVKCTECECWKIVPRLEGHADVMRECRRNEAQLASGSVMARWPVTYAKDGGCFAGIRPKPKKMRPGDVEYLPPGQAEEIRSPVKEPRPTMKHKGPQMKHTGSKRNKKGKT